MYFSLPDSIPPRPLGEARVRKHCVMLLYGRVTTIKYILSIILSVISFMLFYVQNSTTKRQQNKQLDPSDILVRVG